jgi:hypothetical protein
MATGTGHQDMSYEMGVSGPRKESFRKIENETEERQGRKNGRNVRRKRKADGEGAEKK